jgi:hypothetical protein
MKPKPTIGTEYYFWDGEKTSPSRLYKCKCERIITPEETKNIKVKVPHWDFDCHCEYFEEESLYEHWKAEVLNNDWLYSDDTDFFIECSCPKYDDNNLWFVRTKEGDWYSMNIQNSWQRGCLDIDGKKYKNVIEDYKNWANTDDISIYENIT